MRFPSEQAPFRAKIRNNGSLRPKPQGRTNCDRTQSAPYSPRFPIPIEHLIGPLPPELKLPPPRAHVAVTQSDSRPSNPCREVSRTSSLRSHIERSSRLQRWTHRLSSNRVGVDIDKPSLRQLLNEEGTLLVVHPVFNISPSSVPLNPVHPSTYLI